MTAHPELRPSPAFVWRVAAWAPAVLYAGVIFYLSSSGLPGPVAPPQGFDKLLHFGAYGVLGFLLAFGFAREGLRGGRLVGYAALVGTLYGISDEVHQAFVPERTAEVLDAVADALGSASGAFAFHLAHRLWLARRGEAR